MKSLITLGDVCSAIERLPISAVLSDGLNKQGDVAVASGGFADIWQGEHRGEQVAIKVFRILPAQQLKEAKEVRMQPVLEVCSLTTFTDLMETCAHVEEVISRKYPAVSWREHDALSTCPRLRLGTTRQH